jgi:hypothetical protein
MFLTPSAGKRTLHIEQQRHLACSFHRLIWPRDYWFCVTNYILICIATIINTYKLLLINNSKAAC